MILKVILEVVFLDSISFQLETSEEIPRRFASEGDCLGLEKSLHQFLAHGGIKKINEKLFWPKKK